MARCGPGGETQCGLRLGQYSLSHVCSDSMDIKSTLKKKKDRLDFNFCRIFISAALKEVAVNH